MPGAPRAMYSKDPDANRYEAGEPLEPLIVRPPLPDELGPDRVAFAHRSIVQERFCLTAFRRDVVTAARPSP